MEWRDAGDGGNLITGCGVHLFVGRNRALRLGMWVRPDSSVGFRDGQTGPLRPEINSWAAHSPKRRNPCPELYQIYTYIHTYTYIY